jgi:3-oxoacyl-(acyl-carrier-protein) synthase
MGRIFVTGMGIITALGNSVAANRNALLNNVCGITHAEYLSSKYAGQLPFAEIKITTQALKEKLAANDAGLTRTTLLALHAVEEAIADSGLSAVELRQHDTALIGATTVGGMCLTDELYRDANTESEGSEFLAAYNYFATTLYLQKRFNINGVVNTINTACSSSANAIMYGARLLKNGYAKRVIVGGADSLAKFTINGFNALHILSPEICKPFDANRKGLNLGEAAAFLVLEKEEDLNGKKVYAELTGYANTNDAFHASSLSGEGDGPYLAMKQALEIAQLQPAAIDFINAHGTGTENNDEVESIAMLRLFGTPPPFASTKSNTGHTLGAAGSVEAVFSILNLQYQEVYAGLNFSEPQINTGLSPLTQNRGQAINHVMSNSFGFGGNCSSLIFSKT